MQRQQFQHDRPTCLSVCLSVCGITSERHQTSAAQTPVRSTNPAVSPHLQRAPAVPGMSHLHPHQRLRQHSDFSKQLRLRRNVSPALRAGHAASWIRLLQSVERSGSDEQSRRVDFSASTTHDLPPHHLKFSAPPSRAAAPSSASPTPLRGSVHSRTQTPVPPPPVGPCASGRQKCV